MALDGDYAERLVEATRDLDLRWYEEPLLSWDLDGLQALRRRRAPIASGEHNTHVELAQLISAHAVDILQPDLTSCGGLTVALRLARAAKQAGIEFMPHCGGAFSYHLAAALGPESLAEFLFVSGDGREPLPTFGDLVDGEPLPDRGTVSLSAEPGWGLSLVDAGLRRPFGGRDPSAFGKVGGSPS
jgi:L-rhamnonate dehydratase